MAVDPSKAASLAHNIDTLLGDDGGGDRDLAHQYRHLLRHCRSHLRQREAREVALHASVTLHAHRPAPSANGIIEVAKTFERYLTGEDG